MSKARSMYAGLLDLIMVLTKIALVTATANGKGFGLV